MNDVRETGLSPWEPAGHQKGLLKDSTVPFPKFLSCSPYLQDFNANAFEDKVLPGVIKVK